MSDIEAFFESRAGRIRNTYPSRAKAREYIKLLAQTPPAKTNKGNAYRFTNTNARQDLGGVIMRSNWEANFARVLELHSIKYEFEPETFFFPVKTGTKAYIPDFYIPSTDTWIEVKGYLDDKSRIKIKRFRKYNPEKNLVLVVSKYSKDAKLAMEKYDIKQAIYYEDLRDTYKSRILTWEGK